MPPPVISALDRAARAPATGTPPADGTGPDDTDPDLDLYEPYELSEQPVPGACEPGAAAPAPAHLASPQQPGQQGTVPARPGPVPIGIRGGQEITADPAALGGLGLTGPGAPAAARAILAGLLARPPRGPGGTPAEIIIPAPDAARLLPGPARQRAHPPIRGVWVPPSLDTALDEAEAMIVRRARTADGDDGPQAAAVVLAAAPGPAAAQRLAGITAAGRDLGIAVILLGDWPHGTTCHITAGGLISGVTPPQAGLAGTEAYHLEAADLAVIIAQLDQAREPSGEDGPAAPGPPEPGQPHLLSARAAPGPAQAAAPHCPPQHPAGAAGHGTGPGPAGTPVRISVLGPLQITAAGREIGTGLRKARELLAFLAVHPDGASGEAISEALWPGSDPGRGAGQRNLALRKAREMLRTAAGLPAPMWILNASGRYRLDPALTGTDLQAFSDALEAARNASGDARLAACRQAVALYRGELAEGDGIRVGRAVRRGRPPPRPGRLDRHRRDPPAPPTPTRPCPPWRRPSATTPTTSTCTCGSCGCRPQRAAPRPSAGRWPCWNRNSPTSASRPAPRPGRPPPPCSPPPDPHQASNPVAGSTSGAPGDPAGERAPSRTRLDPPPAATLPSPRRDRSRPAQGSATARPTVPAAFRIPAALRSEWQTGTARQVRFTQPGGGHERHGRSRTPHAACGPARIFSAVSPALPAPRSGGRTHHAASLSQRPPPEAPRRSGDPPRESRTRRPFRTASYSVLLSVYLPTPEPPGPGNAQAVPGINLRVNSQTYIRAQLVKQ